MQKCIAIAILHFHFMRLIEWIEYAVQIGLFKNPSKC